MSEDKDLRDRSGFNLVGLLQWILSLIPLSISRVILGGLAEVAFHLRPRDRRQTLSNLRTAFGDTLATKELERLAKRAYRNLGYSVAEFLQFPRGERFFEKLDVKIQGLDIVDKTIAEGKGYVLLSAHAGNWELLAALLVRKGYHLNVVARITRDSRLERILYAYRSRAGMNVLWKGISTMSMMRLLKNKGSLGLVGDLDTKGEGVFIPFFGRSAYTQTGPARLAAHAGVPLLVGFICRTGPLAHEVHVTRKIYVSVDPTAGDGTVSILEAVQIYTKEIESWIRSHPDQWIWMHARWKTTPERLARRKAVTK